MTTKGHFSNLYFIDIATLPLAKDFSNWLDGRRVECLDSMEFCDWLAAHQAFPLQIYMDGIVYKFLCRNDALYFQMGFDAAMRLQFSDEY